MTKRESPAEAVSNLLEVLRERGPTALRRSLIDDLKDEFDRRKAEGKSMSAREVMNRAFEIGFWLGAAGLRCEIEDKSGMLLPALLSYIADRPEVMRAMAAFDDSDDTTH